MKSLMLTMALAKALTFDGREQAQPQLIKKQSLSTAARNINRPVQTIAPEQPIEDRKETHWLADGVPVTVELKNGKIVTFRSSPNNQSTDCSSKLRNLTRQVEQARKDYDSAIEMATEWRDSYLEANERANKSAAAEAAWTKKSAAAEAARRERANRKSGGYYHP